MHDRMKTIDGSEVTKAFDDMLFCKYKFGSTGGSEWTDYDPTDDLWRKDCDWPLVFSEWLFRTIPNGKYNRDADSFEPFMRSAVVKCHDIKIYEYTVHCEGDKWGWWDYYKNMYHWIIEIRGMLSDYERGRLRTNKANLFIENLTA